MLGACSFTVAVEVADMRTQISYNLEILDQFTSKITLKPMSLLPMTMTKACVSRHDYMTRVEFTSSNIQMFLHIKQTLVSHNQSSRR